MTPNVRPYAYNDAWWAIVYAADPVYRHSRGDGPYPLPIERQACDAARDEMIAKGVLTP